MTHRAETILDAVETAITGLPTTGTNVVRGRVDPVAVTPALSLNMGQEQPANVPNVSYQDVYLDFDITLYAKDTAGVDTVLNQIDAEVYAAIMADYTFGLDYVIETIWHGRTAPVRSGAGSAPAAEQTVSYRVYYRHSYTSAEA